MAERDYAWRQAQAERAKRKKIRRRKRRPRYREKPAIVRLTFESGTDLEDFLAWWKQMEEDSEAQR